MLQNISFKINIKEILILKVITLFRPHNIMIMFMIINLTNEINLIN